MCHRSRRKGKCRDETFTAPSKPFSPICPRNNFHLSLVSLAVFQGNLTIQGLACQPMSYTIRLKDSEGKLGEPKTTSFETFGRG